MLDDGKKITCGYIYSSNCKPHAVGWLWINAHAEKLWDIYGMKGTVQILKGQVALCPLLQIFGQNSAWSLNYARLWISCLVCALFTTFSIKGELFLLFSLTSDLAPGRTNLKHWALFFEVSTQKERLCTSPPWTGIPVSSRQQLHAIILCFSYTLDCGDSFLNGSATPVSSFFLPRLRSAGESEPQRCSVP